MAKNYLLQFGSGNPATKSGLAPTFLVFKEGPAGTNLTPPGITEIPSSTGLYYFTYNVLGLSSIAFTVDGATSGLPTVERYISGQIDPQDAIDEQVNNLGTTMVAIGNSLSVMGQSLGVLGGSFNALIGTTGSTFGGLNTNPNTVFGYLKRAQEFNEGNSIFTKTSGAWDIYSRGSSTQLAAKILADTSTSVTKT